MAKEEKLIARAIKKTKKGKYTKSSKLLDKTSGSAEAIRARKFLNREQQKNRMMQQDLNERLANLR